VQWLLVVVAAAAAAAMAVVFMVPLRLLLLSFVLSFVHFLVK
jgi:hypothetical protein